MRNTSNRYRSKFEAAIASRLEQQNIPYEFESFRLAYQTEHRYQPDFLLLNNTVVLEGKGIFLPTDRAKHIAVRKANPSIDIRFVFQNPYLPLRKGAKSTYADWCDAHGFLWCHGPEIPADWLK